MPSIADPSKQDFDLTDVDEDDFSFFLIEPWFMCISLIVLMLIIVAACIKMIIDKKDAEIYLQTLGSPDGKPSPLDKVIKPRLIVIVCTVMIAVILLMNLIVSCVRAFGDDDDDDDHDD